MTITIKGTLPGLNEYTRKNRAHWSKGAEDKRDTQDYILWQLPKVKITKPVHITFTWIEPNKKRDKDNIAFAKKYILDAIVKAGILENDGRKQITGFEDKFEVDGENPRVEIELQEIS